MYRVIQADGSTRALTPEDIEALPPPPAPSVNDYRRAIQAHLDLTASQRGYDSGITCSSYASSTNETWAAEAVAFVAWRDAVWGYAYAELGKVEGGERPQPSVAEIVGELPAMAWPVGEPTNIAPGETK